MNMNTNMNIGRAAILVLNQPCNTTCLWVSRSAQFNSTVMCSPCFVLILSITGDLIKIVPHPNHGPLHAQLLHQMTARVRFMLGLYPLVCLFSRFAVYWLMCFSVGCFLALDLLSQRTRRYKRSQWTERWAGASKRLLNMLPRKSKKLARKKSRRFQPKSRTHSHTHTTQNGQDDKAERREPQKRDRELACSAFAFAGCACAQVSCS